MKSGTNNLEKKNSKTFYTISDTFGLSQHAKSPTHTQGCHILDHVIATGVDISSVDDKDVLMLNLFQIISVWPLNYI